MRRFLSAFVALAMVVGLLSGAIVPVNVVKAQEGTPQTLQVSKWTGPTTLANVSGRPAVIKVGDTYHMWCGSSDETKLYHTSSSDPGSFAAGTETIFDAAGTAPVERGSVAVCYEGGIFYMIAYGAMNKVFNIYTSTDGTAWANKGIVFSGVGLPIDYYKIDAPYLFLDGSTYKLYFQVKNAAQTRYDIYTAEATGTLASIADGNDDADFALANNNTAVLTPGTAGSWDGNYVMHPMVVKDGNVYYMWYSAYGYDQVIGVATSTDGHNWVKSPGNPILPRADYNAVGEPSVIKDGDTWRMWYLATESKIKYLTATGPFEFSTIQSAINAASPGDTINVAAGTYTTGFSIKDKTNLTIAGAGAESTVIAPTSLITTGVGHKYTTNMQAVVFVNNSTGITIKDMTIKSTTATPGAVGAADAIVFFNASAGTISKCKIQGIYAISGGQTGQGLAVDAGASQTTTLNMTDTDITGFQKNGIDIVNGNGTTSNGGTITVNVTGGSITGAGEISTIAQNGIMFWNRSGGTLSGTIDGVTISGFNYTGEDVACGILNYSGASLTIQNSNLAGNEVAVANEDSSLTVDATNNWWGNASGPSHGEVTYGDKVSGKVDFAPWLVEEYTDQTTTTPVEITASELPNGYVGVPYPETSLAATGGAGTYTWSIYAGTLPGGLSLSKAGVISGIPTTAGSYTFAVQVSDGVQANYQEFVVQVDSTAPTITTVSPLPDGIEGVPYSVTLKATGGNGQDYAWSVYSGNLPPGLSLSGAGVISGTPSSVTTATTFHFTVKVESDYQVAFKDFDLAIRPAPTISSTDIEAPCFAGVEKEFSVKAVNPSDGKAYTSVLFRYVIQNAVVADITSFQYYDGSTWYDMPMAQDGSNVVGYFGPSTGFPMSASYEATTLFRIKVATAKTYSITLTLVDLTTPETVLTSVNYSATVYAAPTISSTDIEGPYVVGVEKEFSVKAVNPSDGKAYTSVLFRYVIQNAVVADITSFQYYDGSTWYDMPMAQDGSNVVGYFGPSTGFPMSASYEATTLFRIKVATAKTYSITLTLVDLTTPETVLTSVNYSATVYEPLTITTASLPAGVVGVSYTANLTATGGKGTYTWSIASGTLPEGLTLNPSTGAISGTPTTVGTSNFTVKVTDGSQDFEKSFSITVYYESLTITTASLPAGVVGAPYTANLTATGGKGTSYTWSIASGTLPGGLTLDSSTGVISGTPTTGGTFNFAVKVTDGVTISLPKDLSIVVKLVITASAGPNGSISPSGSVEVNHGANQSFTITPNTGYQIADVLVDGTSVGAVDTYTFSNVAANHTIAATFAINTYTLTINTVGSGTVVANPLPVTGKYDHGTVVTLTATPVSGWHFVGWTGATPVSGHPDQATVTMDANKTVTATFAINTYTITASAGPNGSISPSGSVEVNHGADQSFTITPATGYHILDVLVDETSVGALGTYTFSNVAANHTIAATFAINTYTLTVNTTGSGSVTKAPEQATYTHGTAVQLTATPAAGWHFVNWSGDLSGSTNPATITMDANKTVTATFAINTYTLTVTTTGSGSVTKAPDQATYTHGTAVQLTATPAAGWHFVNWTGATPVSGHPDQATVTMDSDKTVTATFAINTYTLTVNTTGSGSVTKAPEQATYTHGTAVQLTATPAEGWHFVNWSGDLSGSTNPAIITMDANKTITATFAINTYTLTVNTTGSGSVTKAPDQATYTHGTAVQLTATPAAGWHFVNWSGDLTGSTNPVTITMDANKTITATFAINTYTITASAGANGSIAPSGSVEVNHGANQSFTITPNTGYQIADVLVDGTSVGAVGTYTFTNVIANHTITASFSAVTPTVTPGDVNGDGTVTMLDALLAARAAVNISSLTESQFAAADVDQSGTITMLDVLLIARIAMGLEDYAVTRTTLTHSC